MQNNSGRSIWGLIRACFAVGAVVCALVLSGCVTNIIDQTYALAPPRKVPTSPPAPTPDYITRTAIAGGDSWNVAPASATRLVNAEECNLDTLFRINDGRFFSYDGPFCMVPIRRVPGPQDLHFALNRKVKMSSVKIYGFGGAPTTAVHVLALGGYELETTVTDETTSNGRCVTYTFVQPYEWDTLTLRFDNLNSAILMTEVEIYGKYELSVTNP